MAVLTDLLTGLPDRASFQSQVAAALGAGGDSVGVVLIDLDGFAGFNTVLGQPRGDAALIEFAKRLVLEVGPGGSVARIDGDEFAVLLRGCTPASLRELAQLCLGVVRLPIPGCPLAFGASVGTAIAPRDANTTWELINIAGVAQFVAKSSGRDRVVAAKPLMRAQILKSVREGIAAGAFGLNFQPIVSLGAAPRLLGVEGFLRWHHPTRGLIFPGNFLPLLDEPRIARLLGDAALDAAADQARRWLDMRLQFGRIALNISMHQLREGDLAADIEAAFTARRIPAGLLALELPADIYLLADAAPLGARLARLKASGIALTVDSGPAETFDLARLRRFPVDHVKLGRNFARTLSPLEFGELVREIRAAGIVLLAEGVETADQQSVLAAAGCDGAQGWGIGRPMPPAKLAAFVERLAANANGAARQAA